MVWVSVLLDGVSGTCSVFAKSSGPALGSGLLEVQVCDSMSKTCHFVMLMMTGFFSSLRKTILCVLQFPSLKKR